MNSKLADTLRAVALPPIEGAGYELVDLIWVREPAGWVLRILIDAPGGIGHADCERVSRELSAVLDVNDVIPHAYPWRCRARASTAPSAPPTTSVASSDRRRASASTRGCPGGATSPAPSSPPTPSTSRWTWTEPRLHCRSPMSTARTSSTRFRARHRKGK